MDCQPLVGLLANWLSCFVAAAVAVDDLALKLLLQPHFRKKRRQFGAAVCRQPEATGGFGAARQVEPAPQTPGE